MEMVLFIGIPGAGKSSYYLQRFYATHVWLSLDMLRSRHRERAFLDTCLQVQQPFVVDNTNVTKAERALYIQKAKAFGFRVRGFFFYSTSGRVPGSLRGRPRDRSACAAQIS